MNEYIVLDYIYTWIIPYEFKQWSKSLCLRIYLNFNQCRSGYVGACCKISTGSPISYSPYRSREIEIGKGVEMGALANIFVKQRGDLKIT